MGPFPKDRVQRLWWDFFTYQWKEIGKLHAKLNWVESNLKIQTKWPRSGKVKRQWRTVSAYIPS